MTCVCLWVPLILVDCAMCRLQSWLKLISTANVTIKHIHFKYEDADTSKGNEFVLGFAIDKIQINALSVRESRTSAWQQGVHDGCSQTKSRAKGKAGEEEQASMGPALDEAKKNA